MTLARASARSLLKPGRLVLITWLDAHQPWENSWEDPNTMDEVVLEPVRTVGWVLHVGKDAVRLTMTVAGDGVNSLFIIPFSGMECVQWLGVDEIGDCDR